MKAIHAYDIEAFAVRSDESGLKCEDRTLAHQSFQDECDINTIVRRFGLTGELPQNLRMPEFGDYTGVKDFHSAMEAISKAQENFMALPATVRAEFDNDPQQFLEFCADPANLEKARQMGLARAEELKNAAAAVAGIPGPSVRPPTPAGGGEAGAAK